MRSGEFSLPDSTKRQFVKKVTLDTGATVGNYIGRDVLKHFSSAGQCDSCEHRATLCDGKT